MDKISLKAYAKYMQIEKGDIILVSSDIKRILMETVKQQETPDLNQFIDGLTEAVGEEGTVIFPTYNWDFCQGVTFDYRNTSCKTGSLGTVALKRADFKRTQHPIYSFAVWGRYQNELCQMENKDSFGVDSPFDFFNKHNVKNYIIDVSLKNCFTYAHYAEENSGVVAYRYIKNFTGGYIDEYGTESQRTYSMFVRDLNLDVINLIDPIEKDFLEQGAESIIKINSSEIKKIALQPVYDILIEDIIHNKSRKLCTYIGQ